MDDGDDDKKKEEKRCVLLSNILINSVKHIHVGIDRTVPLAPMTNAMSVDVNEEYAGSSGEAHRSSSCGLKL